MPGPPAGARPLGALLLLLPPGLRPLTLLLSAAVLLVGHGRPPGLTMRWAPRSHGSILMQLVCRGVAGSLAGPTRIA
jgi:hypothetical protein